MQNRKALILRDHFRSFWNPEPDCPVWLWAENNVVLSQMEAADMAGPFRSSLTPFIREPLECFRDDTVSEVTLVFAAQVVKTLMIMLGVAWWLDHHSGRCIWVMDTENNARSFSETRWQPLLEECPALKRRLPTDRDQFKNLQQRVGASLIHFVGSNSPGNLSSRPADIGVMDEVDKFAVTTSREANAVDLVEQRTKSRADTKIIKTSSPTSESGLIWKSFIGGDQRLFFVPCPHCATMMTLEFENVRWDPEAKAGGKWNFQTVRNTAAYICPYCQGRIHDGHKTRMLAGGEWRPTNPSAPAGVRSYQLNSLYSPWVKTSFGNLAVEFIKYKLRFDMKGWDNGYMARPSTETVAQLDWEILATRRETYEKPIPDQVALLTAFCDVQGDRLELGLIGWGEGSENWLIERHAFHGDPSNRRVWDEMAETLLQPRPLPIDWTFVDYGGHHGQEAIEFVKRNSSQRVYLQRGSNREDAPVNHLRTKTKKPVVALFETGVGNAKRKILSMLNETAPGPGYCHFPDAEWCDEEAFKQLCSEEIRQKYKHGAIIEYWFQTRPRNEMLDIYVGCYAGLCRLSQGIVRRRIAVMRNRLHPGPAPTPPPHRPSRRPRTFARSPGDRGFGKLI